MSGWIALSRDIQRHWLWKNPEHVKAWVAILMAANWARVEVPCGTHITICERGQCIRSQEQWALIFGKNWSRSKVQRFFKLLQNANMIRSEIAHKAIKLTVVNYNTYQDQRADNEHKVSRSRADTEHIVSTDNNITIKPVNNLITEELKKLRKENKSLKAKLKAIKDKVETSKAKFTAMGCGHVASKLASWERIENLYGMELIEEACAATKPSKRWDNVIEDYCSSKKPVQKEINRREDGTPIF